MEEQTVVNNQIQQPPVNPATPKSNYWIIAIIVFVLLLIIGSIYTLVLQPKKEIMPPKPLALPSPTSPTPSLDPTANWKKYINPIMQFSIKSPSDFEFFPEKPPGGGAVPSLDELLSSTLLKRKTVEEKDEQRIKLKKNISFDAWLNINVKSWSALIPELLGKGITFEKWVQDEISIHELGQQGARRSSLTVDNIPATRISYTDQSSHQRIIITYVKTTTRMYEISVTIDLDKEKEYATLSDQILSTFQFLN